MIEQLERIVAMLAERRQMRYKTLVLWGSSDLEAGFSYGAMEKVRRARQSRFSPSPGTLYRATFGRPMGSRIGPMKLARLVSPLLTGWRSWKRVPPGF
jgi:hypothetical protein